MKIARHPARMAFTGASVTISPAVPVGTKPILSKGVHMRFSSIALVLVGSLTAVGMIGCTQKSTTTQSAPLAAPVPTIDTTKPTIVTIKPKPVATTAKAPKPVVEADPRDEFEILLDRFNYTGADRQRVMDKRATFKAKRDALDATPDSVKRIALNAKGAELKKAGQTLSPEETAEQKALYEAYFKARSQLRAEVLAEFKPEELKEWAAEKLTNNVEKSLKKAKITPEQHITIGKLALQAVNNWYNAKIVAEDPYFITLAQLQTNLVESVKADVLTADQREKLIPATRPAASQAASQPATK
jgi:hypothetical protein